MQPHALHGLKWLRVMGFSFCFLIHPVAGALRTVPPAVHWFFWGGFTGSMCATVRGLPALIPMPIPPPYRKRRGFVFNLPVSFLFFPAFRSAVVVMQVDLQASQRTAVTRGNAYVRACCL